jgi:hypothetical protein
MLFRDLWTWPVDVDGASIFVSSVSGGAVGVTLDGTRYLDWSSDGLFPELPDSLGVFFLPDPIKGPDVLWVAVPVFAADPLDVRFTLQIVYTGEGSLFGEVSAVPVVSSPETIDGLLCEVVKLPRRRAGAFVLPTNKFIDNRAYPRHIQAEARGAAGMPVRVRWATENRRTIHYWSVPGARVFRDRANRDGYWQVGGIVEGDDQAQFETLWDILSADQTGIVRYYPNLDLSGADGSLIPEYVYLSPPYSESLRACLVDKVSDFGREFYDIVFEIGVL